MTMSNHERRAEIGVRFNWKQSYLNNMPITMEFKTKDNEWMDWVELKKSNVDKKGLGLFACVDMPKYTIISLYIGNRRRKLMINVVVFSAHPFLIQKL